jgi:hypothetical protein
VGGSSNGCKSVFLHGYLQKEMYMQQLVGFFQDGPTLVWKFKKSLYGIKKSLWAWYDKIHTFINCGYSHWEDGHGIYIRHHENHAIIIVLYVDDLAMIGSSSSMVEEMNYNSRNPLRSFI